MVRVTILNVAPGGGSTAAVSGTVTPMSNGVYEIRYTLLQASP
jgi:formiminotetrahydrofolate cyclodeaminase